MSVLDNFGEWKQFLGDRLQRAENKGMDHDKLAGLATELGGYLQDKVDPKNGEERLLSDLWRSADDNERQALASAMIKYVEDEGNQGEQQQ